MTAMLTQSIGLIGAGQMATALGQGFVRAGLVPGNKLLAADPLPEARERFTAATGGRATADNAEVAAQSDVVILAVKPQQMARVMAELRGSISGRGNWSFPLPPAFAWRPWPKGSARGRG